MSWLNRLSQTRVQAQQPQGAEAPKGAKAKAAQPLLQDTLASEKVLKRLGASVANSGDDMQAIAAAVTALKTHRAAQFGRAVDAFYNALGRSTQHLPDAEKRQVVSGSIRAMRGLVEAVGPHDNLIPAMTALSSLLEPRGNTRDVPAGKHAEAAKTMILGLLDELEGRAGVSSLMFGFRNVVEAVESRRPELKSSQRPAIWQQAAEYLGRAVPVTGCDQGELGRIVGTFQRALRETPDDSNAAFTAALRDVQAELTAPREALSRQLGELAVGLREGTPARAAADAMMGALAKVVEANPSGPATLLGLVEALANRALPSVQRAADEGTAAGYGSLARVIELAARAPGVEGILQYLVDHHAMLAESPEARAALARVDRLKLPNNLAGALLKAHVVAVGMDPAQADLAPALAKLERLPPGPGLQAAAVLLERLDHDPVDLMEALHVESRRIQDPAELRAFADRFQMVHQRIGLQLAANTRQVATAAARSPGDLDLGTIDRIGSLVQTVQAHLPGLDVTALLERGRGGEPGLIDLAHQQAFLHDPVPFFNTLLQQSAAHLRGKNAADTVRVAVQIAANLGRFDRDPRRVDLPRISADFTAAVAEPGALVATRGAGRDAKKSVAAYVAAHPVLPVEVAMTAARTLPAPELTWVVGEMSSTRSHAHVRALRDAIFAVAQTGRADFFTALAKSPSDAKAKAAAATYVATEHRQGNAPAVPWDQLIQGLNEGKNPVEAMKAAKLGAALQGIDLGNVANLDPTGGAILEKCSAEIGAFVAFLDSALHGTAGGYFLPPVLEAIRAHADGTWPAPKYESASAREHLAPLRPEQLEAWIRPMTTSAQGQAVQAADDPAAQEALQLLKGVAKTLKANVPLAGRGFEDVGYNQASQKALGKQRDELLATLRDAKKGSKAHRDASKAMGPIQERLALIELEQGLKRQFADGFPADAQGALAELKPLAQAAMGVLRRRRQAGFLDALESAVAVVKPAPTQARQGVYAADDDTLDAWMKSFGGGSCLDASRGHNRASLAEFISGSQYKMIRAMRDDTPIGRGCLRLLRVELPNGYKGLALYMDHPMPTPAGHPGAAEQKLMYQHSMAKAAAMKVPFMIADAQMANQVAAERGLKAEHQQVSVWLHRGVTGMHQSEGLNANDYFIGWEGVNTGYAVTPAAQKEAARNYGLSVVMPPA